MRVVIKGGGGWATDEKAIERVTPSLDLGFGAVFNTNKLLPSIAKANETDPGLCYG